MHFCSHAQSKIIEQRVTRFAMEGIFLRPFRKLSRMIACNCREDSFITSKLRHPVACVSRWSVGEEVVNRTYTACRTATWQPIRAVQQRDSEDVGEDDGDSRRRLYLGTLDDNWRLVRGEVGLGRDCVWCGSFVTDVSLLSRRVSTYSREACARCYQKTDWRGQVV